MDISAPVTLTIIVITCITSIRGFYNQNIVQELLFNPHMVTERNQVYRLFTKGFVHADWLHLGFNMYVLWMFGQPLEADPQWLGSFGLFTMYMVALPVSALPSLIRARGSIHFNALGASGAVSAIVASFSLFDPNRGLGLLFIPMPAIPAWIFGLLYLAYSFYMTFRPNRGANRINHDAHLWGFLGGIVMTLIMRPSIASTFFDQIQNI
ncbi:MAG: rhomboid family intramembrane serine protease [Bacteroidia bacterium]|nr:rhomboid family intramembrane serine protease [Bacteroidia bacterium]